MQIVTWRSPKKGSFLASFFVVLYLCLSSIASGNELSLSDTIIEENKTELATLAENPTWASLLHVTSKKTHITDKNFILSLDSFSLAQEMKATIHFLYSENAHNVCRFPARYFWLKKNLSLPHLDLNQCIDLKEFEIRAPAEKIFLVFASENLSQPSSMMGHVLLKISPERDSKPNYAISFYTDTRGINLPKLLYESMITGKKGYFSLSPYQEKLTRYNNRENRNVWEYELNIDDFKKKLIQYHLYELKQTELTYFFDEYNCATLIQFILNIASDTNHKNTLIGVTPIDSVKAAEQQLLFRRINLVASDKWSIRMLSDNMEKSTLKKVKKVVKKSDIEHLKSISDAKERYLAFELVSSYLNTKTQIELKDMGEFTNSFNAEKNKTQKFNIDLSNYKKPTATPGDSQLTIGSSQFSDENLVFINFLPTSHKLEDDNRQYFGETSLTLGETSVAVSPDTGKLFFDSFTLYGVKSLIPHDYFSGGLSGSFRLGAQQQINAEWLQHTKTYAEGALGKTYGIGKDISVYSLLGAGISLTRKDFFSEITPEVGVIVKEIFNMKSIIQYQYSFTNSIENPDYRNMSFTQAFYINNSWGFFAKAENIAIENRDEERYSLWLKHYF